MSTHRFLRPKVAAARILFVGLLVMSAPSQFLAARQHPSSQGSNQAVEEPIVIPMELLANRPMVRVKVNGQGPFAFVVAPEAQATLIDQTLALELDPLQQRYKNAASLLDIELEIGGKLLKLSVGSTDAAKLVPEFGALARPRGIISASLWPGHLVTLDYPRYQISVAPGSLAEPNQQDVFSLKLEPPEQNVHVAMADRAIPCQLDPLFPGALLLPDTYAKSLPLVGKLGEARLMVTPKGRAFVREGQLAGDATLGMFKFSTPFVQFTDTGESCVIGGHWLMGFSITYDMANARVKLTRRRQHGTGA